MESNKSGNMAGVSQDVLVKISLEDSLEETKRFFEANNTSNTVIYCRIGELLLSSDYLNVFKTDIGRDQFEKIFNHMIKTVENTNIKMYQQKEYYFTDKVYIVRNQNGDKIRTCWSVYDANDLDFVNSNKGFDFKISAVKMTEYNSTKFPSLKTYHSVKFNNITEITLEDGNVLQFKKTEENDGTFYIFNVVVNDFDGLQSIINYITKCLEYQDFDLTSEGNKVYCHNYEEDSIL